MPFGKKKVKSKKFIGQRRSGQWAKELERYRKTRKEDDSLQLQEDDTTSTTNGSTTINATAVTSSPCSTSINDNHDDAHPDVFSAWGQVAHIQATPGTKSYSYTAGDTLPRCNLVVYDSGQWTASVAGIEITMVLKQELKLPMDISMSHDKVVLKNKLEQLHRCSGNIYPEVDISTMQGVHKLPSGLIYSDDCTGVSLSARCRRCDNVKRAIDGRVRRLNTKSASSQSSKKRLSHMTPDQLKTLCKQRKTQADQSKREIQRLRKKVDQLQKKAVHVADENLNNLISETVNAKSLEPTFNSDLQSLLWQDNVKQAGLKNKKSMRWHPAIIRWALTLRSMSKSSYDYVRDSGGLALPSSRTLDAYTCYKETDFGIDKEAIQQLSTRLHGRRDIVLMHDEMKIKNKLVYHRATGNLVGYVALNDINHALQEISQQERQVASHALCFIARAIGQNEKMPVAHYATTSLTGCQIYHLFWDVVRALDLADLVVRTSISDGAGSNRRFFELHETDFIDDGVTFRCHNKFREGAVIYFVSDVPHLLKTTRNCLENSGSNKKTRDLILHGKPVRWCHISKLFRDTLTNTSFTRLFKLKSEHIYLQPFSRMKVNLAAQVLSQSVANALRSANQDYLSSTIEFVEKFNKAFDILNIRSPTEGRDQRKDWKYPFTSADDQRLEWLENSFLGWLGEWRREVEAQPNLSKQEQDRCQLSHQTVLGWMITCHSFKHLVADLLRDGYAYVLSEKVLCQDLVELHFGYQRKACGTNKTPNAAEYLQSEKKYSVAKELHIPVKNGNSTSTNSLIDITNLPKLKRGK